VGCTLLAAGIAGCGPDYNAVANQLRMQTIQQQRQISDLQAKLTASDAAVKQLQAEADNKLPRVATLPDERLAAMYTAARIEILPQTDSWEFQSGKGLAGFRVHFRTLTDDGMNIPATGDVTIEAFELAPAPAQPQRLGTWTFSAAQIKKCWYSGLGLNQFACNCPWTKPPTSADVTFRMTFRDALTGRVLEAHLDKKVTLPKGSASK
jgi:hypothetical protein